jgi:hypothetical protein
MKDIKLLKLTLRLTGNQNVYLDTSPNFLNYFKYASITSVDVERTFSLYKHILNIRRYYFQEHNLEMYIIINLNSEKLYIL